MSELILQQFIRTRAVIHQVMDGVAVDAMELVPQGFNNNIHWQLGHILVTTEFFLLEGQETLPQAYNMYFGPGTKPADWSADVPAIEVLLQQLDKQLVQLQAVDVQTFTQKLEKRMLGCETVGDLAALGAFHEAMHVGQIQQLKKLVLLQ